ncbi:hypothetical protein chiPu_0031310, partial [Chiloscyllium punctatum]|nr:hypothetical protein [Chiloscyllium punctatum]
MVMSGGAAWPEVRLAVSERRRELVLRGPELEARVRAGGVDPGLFELPLLQHLELGAALSELPEAVCGLQGLRSLVLRGNRLKELPEQLGLLSELRSLDVSGNRLQCVPASLGLLTQLRGLNLSGNLLQELPRGLSRCSGLTHLELSHNRLQELPGDILEKPLPLLTSLTAAGNCIHSLGPGISRLPALRVSDGGGW